MLGLGIPVRISGRVQILFGHFSSWCEPQNESEASSKVFIAKISFHSNVNKSNFHMKSFAVRFKGIRKWPIIQSHNGETLII